MTLELLKTSDYFCRIPEEGFVMAVFDDHILFERYTKTADGLSFPEGEPFQKVPLLRLHCFDRDTEYRLIAADDGDRLIETVLTAEEEKKMEPDLLFEDEMLLRREYCKDGMPLEKLRIVNRYRYTFFDTMTLHNYRISC